MRLMEAGAAALIVGGVYLSTVYPGYKPDKNFLDVIGCYLPYIVSMGGAGTKAKKGKAERKLQVCMLEVKETRWDACKRAREHIGAYLDDKGAWRLISGEKVLCVPLP